jgi:large subunit ribosomal protein L4
MEKAVLSTQGKKVRTIQLSEEVFNREVSDGSIYHAIRNELANIRVGTHSTKTRAEVNGSRKKPWKQKGTGRARSGTKQSPLWVGGGIAFGPKPRDYSYKMPKKVKRLALKSILSLKNQSDELSIVEDFTVATGRAKDISLILAALVPAERTVLILKDDDQLIRRAGRNIPWLTILSFNRLRAHDLFYAKKVVALEGAALKLNDFYGDKAAAEE